MRPYPQEKPQDYAIQLLLDAVDDDIDDTTPVVSVSTSTSANDTQYQEFDVDPDGYKSKNHP